MNYQGKFMNGYPCCNNTYNVVETTNVEDIPYYTNHHTHIINNCIKRHINIPTYSCDAETVVLDEYVNTNPVYYNNTTYQNYNPYYNNQMNQEYMGNVGTNPISNNYANINPNFNGFNPYNNM